MMKETKPEPLKTKKLAFDITRRAKISIHWVETLIYKHILTRLKTLEGLH